MPMKKGQIVGRYVTLSDVDAVNYRMIAAKMTKAGHVMKHATARGIFMSGLAKIARNILMKMDIEPTDEAIDDMLRDESFHKYVGEVLEAEDATHVRSHT